MTWKINGFSARAFVLLMGLGTMGTLSGGAYAAGPFVDGGGTTAQCLENGSERSFACGNEAIATGTGNTAVGDHAIADNNSGSGTFKGRSAAYGANAEARGYKSTAIGAASYAGWSGDPDGYTGPYFDYTTAIGAGAQAAQTYATGLGAEAHATGVDSTAVGADSEATHDNSAAFGAHVSTTRENQMAFGMTSNTYTMAGINSDESKSFQDGPTYFVTSDADGNLATTSFDVAGMSNQVNKNTDGVALALASAGPAILPDGKHFALSGGYGNFDGSSAFAVNGVAALNSSGLFLSGGLGVGVNTGVVGGSAHVTYAW